MRTWNTSNQKKKECIKVKKYFDVKVLCLVASSWLARLNALKLVKRKTPVDLTCLWVFFVDLLETCIAGALIGIKKHDVIYRYVGDFIFYNYLALI